MREATKGFYQFGDFSYNGNIQNTPITSTPIGYATATYASVWAFRSIEVRSQAFNRLPVMVINDDTKEEYPNHPFMIALERNQQRIQYRYMWSRLIWGETFILLRKNEKWVSDLQWLNNIGMNVQDELGFVTGYQYIPPRGGGVYNLTASEVAMFVDPNPFDDIRGMSRFESVMNEIGVDRAISQRVRAWYANNARPSLLIIPDAPLTDKQAQGFMDFWRANLQGPKNAGKPMLMPSAIKEIKEVGQAPSEDDVVLRESLRREIAAAFGVPLSMAGAWDDAQYQSLPQQRRSFYEETVIPDAELASDEWTRFMLRRFDPNPALKVIFKTDGILALMEDQAQKEAILTARLQAGAITLNEYREAVGLERIEQGDVYYMPSGVSVVSQANLATYAPAAPAMMSLPETPDDLAVTETVSETELPVKTVKPIAPRLGLPDVVKAIKANYATQSRCEHCGMIHDENPLLSELAAWDKKVKNAKDKWIKASAFKSDIIPTDLQDTIRMGINNASDNLSARRAIEDAIKAVKDAPVTFGQPLPQATPEEYAAYWKHYDELMQRVGDEWLEDYMQQIQVNLAEGITPEQILTQVQSQLALLQPEITQEWLGSPDDMGTLAQVILAGMASGNEALTNTRISLNPMKAVGLSIAWDLLSQEAYEFASTYINTLIRKLNDTTIRQIQQMLAQWMIDGSPLSSLELALTDVLLDKSRAKAIAQTESTRAYFEGSKQRWQNANVTRAKWMTVRDGDVCPICQSLHGQVANLSQGWLYGSVYLKPPAHPRCRCFAKPVIDDEDL
jgi:HK97 family phage portal protein